jgi:capsular polysaccharide biosynthesis protein
LFASPPYAAVIMCEPTANAAVVNVATPEPLSVPVPRVVPPSLNVTVPVGVPEVPVTVALNVTGAPESDGFTLDISVVIVEC